MKTYDDDLLAALLAQHRPRRPGCRARIANAIGWVLAVGMFLTVMAKVLPGVLVDYGVTTPEQLVKVLHMDVATPAAPTSTTPLPIKVLAQDGKQQPVYQPAAPLPDCATVQDTVTACERDDFASARREVDPTPTPEPTPTATGFWTQEEIAAFTATAEAFYNPETLPTAPPAFVQAVNEACADPTKVMQSKLLQTWCGDD